MAHPGGVTISQYANHPGNFFPPSLDAVGFVDLDGGDYRLRASSPYRKAGTEGNDLGADIEALRVSGLFPGGPGRPLPESERCASAP